MEISKTGAEGKVMILRNVREGIYKEALQNFRKHARIHQQDTAVSELNYLQCIVLRHTHKKQATMRRSNLITLHGNLLLHS
jgi:hypothetical protein